MEETNNDHGGHGNDTHGAGGERLHPNVFMAIGLHLVGFGGQRLSKRTQTRRFKEMYGVRPIVVQNVWYDLKDKVPGKTKIEHLFWALYFLKKYPTEGEMSSVLRKDPTTIRKWVWTIIFGIQELSATKIRFPPEGFSLVFTVSVDGTDCPIEEPRPFNTNWFSQKFKGPAVKYEVAINVLTGDCVWVSGPHRGSKNDITIFREGLMNHIPVGKLVIADKGYRGEPKIVSFPNHLDDKDVAEFKSRVRARQETFNMRLKSFDILHNKFRHKPVMDKHGACFMAVATLVQYGIDTGSPLFGV